MVETERSPIKDMVPLTVWVPRAHREELETQASCEDRSLSNIVRRIVREHLERTATNS